MTTNVLVTPSPSPTWQATGRLGEVRFESRIRSYRCRLHSPAAIPDAVMVNVGTPGIE
jgi:hypothetical protein